MRLRDSLKVRFVAAMFSLVLLICGTFYFAVHQFLEVLESQLADTVVKRELHELRDAFSRGEPLRYQDGKDLRGFIVEQAASPPPDLPTAILSWPSGHYGEITIEGREHYAGREDAVDAVFLMLLDLAEFEALEADLARITYAVILSALLAALLLGYWLSCLVMRPVTRLASQLSEMTPDGTAVPLAGQFPDHAMGLIARAFDRYQARIEQFIGRERSFTDDAGHELRTPLAVILSALPLLNEEPGLSERGRERLARIERAAGQMHALVEALLSLAREEDDGPDQICRLDEVLRDVAELQRQAVEDKGLELRLSINGPVKLRAPAGLATAVIGNLLANAVQNTSKGHIELRLETDRLIVADTGVGMDAAESRHIFERRYRGVRSQGLGIGLYLVRRICERLGWVIEVDSTPGTGTRFVLHLNPSALTKN